MDAFATAISLSLQHGVPLATMVDKFSHLRFEPAGFTGNPEIPMAKSVMDYIFRWLANRFLTADGHPKPGTNGNGNGTKNGHGSAAGAAHSGPQPTYHAGRAARSQVKGQEDSPSCHNCGDVMVRNGTCYKCNTCGETSGCS
jgi:ribonucleoside-diphosphate reductase alpha chain